MTCHTEQAGVVGTDHSLGELGVNGPCLGCHSLHEATGPHLLPSSDEESQTNPASARCLRCHDGSSPATAVVFASHPTGLLLTTQGLPFRYEGRIPYYNSEGEPTSDRAVGEITCSTCHDPHRWDHDGTGGGAADGTEQNSFLRDPDDTARFCTVCHGVDARPRLRFFHTGRFRDGDAP